MKIIVLLVLFGLVISNELSAQNNLRQDYKFNAWSLDCTNKCQSLGGVVCGYATQVCCNSGQCQKGWKEEECGVRDRIHVNLCVPGPKN